MNTGDIVGGFVWAAVVLGYAASVWKLGRASRDATWPNAIERGTRIEIVDSSHHGGQGWTGYISDSASGSSRSRGRS